MIGIVVTMLLAGAGADLRRDFATCLKQASSKAQTEKVAADGFVAFARTTCASTEAPFQASLTTTNVSHGMSKKAAATDAADQIESYYTERLENYKIELQPLAPEKPK
jgi:hypothetical protein